MATGRVPPVFRPSQEDWGYWCPVGVAGGRRALVGITDDFSGQIMSRRFRRVRRIAKATEGGAVASVYRGVAVRPSSEAERGGGRLDLVNAGQGSVVTGR